MNRVFGWSIACRKEYTTSMTRPGQSALEDFDNYAAAIY